LRHFRGATLLAVAVTGLLLLLLSPIEAEVAQDMEDQTAPVAEAQDESTRAPADTGEAVARVNQILQSLYGALPRLIVAVAVLIAAWLLTRLVRLLLRSLLRRWDGIHALSAVVSVAIWFLGVGIAFTVLVGDIRALVGSIGLIGLALSWALQAPIESFTGWLLNSFKGYYRVGDRIAVGEVFGDVYRIDFLTTTVWEIGGPSREGFVHAEQPTGRLVSFPNNAILTGTIVNLTRDYPYVWDELTVEVANESDLRYTIGVLEGVGRALFGGSMDEAARRYKAILASEGLEGAVAEEPQVFISPSESWTNITIRYLVPARERRKWKSELTLLAAQEMNKPDHSGRIIPVYPRRQIQFIGPDGAPTAFDVLMKGGGDRS
jgi:small-conductance mechanosensitive channel